MTQSFEEKIFRCWLRGDGIREAITSIKRTTGERMEFESVRQVYVDLSVKFATMGEAA